LLAGTLALALTARLLASCRRRLHAGAERAGMT